MTTINIPDHIAEQIQEISSKNDLTQKSAFEQYLTDVLNSDKAVCPDCASIESFLLRNQKIVCESCGKVYKDSKQAINNLYG